MPTVESVKQRTSVRDTVGTNIKDDSAKFMTEYERRKSGNPSEYGNRSLAQLASMSVATYIRYSVSQGAAKSVIALEDAIYAASQGANVLIWAMEMGWYEVLVRIYVSISGESGVTTAQLNGVDMSAGFDSRDVRLGQLNDEFETAFRQFVETLNEIIPGNLTVRAVDDEDFGDRTLQALTADIEMTDADYVVIDPFYYLHYEKNTSKDCRRRCG